MENKNTKGNKGSKVAAGVTLATLAAAAAGAIFLYGTDAGKKRRKQIRSWSLRMKGDVLDRMEKMKDWSEDAYIRVVDGVADKYKKVKNVDALELAAIAKDLKTHWKNIKRSVEGGTKKKSPQKKAKVSEAK